MKKHTKTKTAVGFLSLLIFAGINLFCGYHYLFVSEVYSYMPDGDITIEELKNFDVYKTRDTFGMPSDKFVPVEFVIHVKKKISKNNFHIIYKRKNGRLDYYTNSIKYMHHQIRTNLASKVEVGDTVNTYIYYYSRKNYERFVKQKDNPKAYVRSARNYKHQTYYIKDQSIVELKREKNLRFKVYPSPAVEEVNVRLDLSESKPGKVTVFNTMGQVLVQEELYDVTQEKNIPLQDYPSGTYFVQVNFLGENFVKKIIKK